MIDYQGTHYHIFKSLSEKEWTIDTESLAKDINNFLKLIKRTVDDDIIDLNTDDLIKVHQFLTFVLSIIVLV